MRASLIITCFCLLTACTSYTYPVYDSGEGGYYVYGGGEEPGSTYYSGSSIYFSGSYYPYWSIDYFYFGDPYYPYGRHVYYSPYYYPYYFSILYPPWHWYSPYGYGGHYAWHNPYRRYGYGHYRGGRRGIGHHGGGNGDTHGPHRGDGPGVSDQAPRRSPGDDRRQREIVDLDSPPRQTRRTRGNQYRKTTDAPVDSGTGIASQIAGPAKTRRDPRRTAPEKPSGLTTVVAPAAATPVSPTPAAAGIAVPSSMRVVAPARVGQKAPRRASGLSRGTRSGTPVRSSTPSNHGPVDISSGGKSSSRRGSKRQQERRR